MIPVLRYLVLSTMMAPPLILLKPVPAILALSDSGAASTTPESLSQGEMNGALVLAMSDSSKSCVIPLNGLVEVFLYFNDPINKR